MFKFIDVQIQLPNSKFKNIELDKKFNLPKNTFFFKTGVLNRRISNVNETTETLGLSAAQKIKKKNNIKNLTHIISVTNTPSIMFPSLAHYVKSKISDELKKNIQCIGINSGCSGFVDALIISSEIFRANKNSMILIVTADTYTKFITPTDKSILPVFGDGASAILLKSNKHGWKLEKKFSDTISHTQNFLSFRKKNKNFFIEMKGPELINFAIKSVIPKIIEFSKKERSCILFSHQAGKIIFDLIKKKIKSNIILPENYKYTGNLVSTSIPYVLKKNFSLINNFEKIIFSGFGVGLTHTHIKIKKVKF